MTNTDREKILSGIENKGSEIMQSFNQYSKEQMIPIINGFYSHHLNQFKNDNYLHQKTLLDYYSKLNYFGQHYNSLQTLENLIIEYNKTDVKDVLFTKYPIECKLITSTTYIVYQGILWNETVNRNPTECNKKEFIEPLMKAKSKLSSLYSQYLTSKNILTEDQLIHCLQNLAFCYSQLSRWYEALYYIALGEKIDPNNINLHFAKQATLERIQNATCNVFSRQLILSTLESLKILEHVNYPEESKRGFKRTQDECQDILKRNNITIESIVEHRKKGVIQYSKRTNYLKFCSNNQLFLSEHSLHCNCNKGTQDKITIRSSHDHTHIDFLQPFEQILEAVVVDFSLARRNYFNSLQDQKIIGYQTRFSKIQNIDFKLKIALLKDSFRLCYSILDTIAIAILEALEIDYVKIRKDKNNLNVHFTNIWDDLITQEHFQQNFYLQSLYSISEDINTKVGGHREFRKIRNAMEHKIFHVCNNKDPKQKIFNASSYYEINYQELLEKTLVLLVYTKSLIHSYTYFMRRVSISKVENDDFH